MSIIRTLIIREWFRYFAGSALILFLLMTIANLVSGFLRMNVTPIEVVLNHLLEAPRSMKLILPVSCLIASLFSINKLKNRNELTAIFAAGYSRKKFVYDIISAAAIVAVMQLFISSYVEPFAKANKHFFIKDSEAKFRNLKSKGLRASTIGSGKIWYKSDEYFFSFSTFDEANSILSNVTLYYFSSDHRLTRKIEAQYLKHIDRNKWMIVNGKEYNQLNEEGFPTYESFKHKPISIQETPEDFMQIESDITTLSIFNLFEYIRRLKNSGINTNEYEVLFLDKISSSLICIVLAIISAMAIFSPNRRGSSFGKNLIFVFVFTIVYWLVNAYFIELGKNSKLNPYLSCFGVPFLFSLYLVYHFYKNRVLR